MGNQSSNCDQVNNNNNSEMEQRQENEVNSTRTAEQPSEDNAAEVATQDVADEKATEQGRLPDSPKEELEEPIVEKKFAIASRAFIRAPTVCPPGTKLDRYGNCRPVF